MRCDRACVSVCVSHINNIDLKWFHMCGSENEMKNHQKFKHIRREIYIYIGTNYIHRIHWKAKSIYPLIRRELNLNMERQRDRERERSIHERTNAQTHKWIQRHSINGYDKYSAASVMNLTAIIAFWLGHKGVTFLAIGHTTCSYIHKMI